MLIKKKELIRYGIILGIIIIFAFIDYRISLGIILGIIFAYIDYKLIEFRYDYLSHKKAIVMLGALFGIIILAIPILISVLLPNIFSVIGVAIGLLYNKYYLYIKNIIKKE